MKTITAFFLALLVVFSVHAADKPVVRKKPAPKIPPATLVSPGVETKAVRGDDRIRVVAYDPDAVIRLHGAYGYTLAIEFAHDEKVATVSLGDTTAWQAIARENMLFLKPHEDKAETNLLVQTTRRSYTFNLMAFQPVGVEDGRLTYRLRFRYPQDEARQMEARNKAASEEAQREARTTVGGMTGLAKGQLPQSRSKSPAQWNFNYSFKGSKVAAPVQVIDDGEFTYVRFAHYESVPAVFEVDTQKNETLANFRREGDWFVLEKITRQLVFRTTGNIEIACVFNDAFPQRPDSALRER